MKNNQLAIVDGKVFTEKDMYSTVDIVIDNLNQTGDIQQATTSLIALEKLGNVVGHAKARLLFGMGVWWHISHQMGNFYDYVESHTSIKKVTIDRYITVQSCIDLGEIPDDVAHLPMRTLVPIAKTLSHGHHITRSQFDKIIKANNSREIEGILRIIKNKPPRKGSRQIYWERDGSIVSWKNNKKKFLGWLDKEIYAKDDEAKEAIDMILDNSGITRK